MDSTADGTNITVRERLCDTDVELLPVSLRPFHLQREIFVAVEYIHPTADAKRVSRVVQNCQSTSLDALNFILGVFNRCTLKRSLGSFYQYVTRPTSISVKGYFKSVVGPPLGLSDQNLVLLLPVSEPVVRRRVQVWTEDRPTTTGLLCLIPTKEIKIIPNNKH